MGSGPPPSALIVCAAPGSVVGGRSAVAASPGAQATSGILEVAIRSRRAPGTWGAVARKSGVRCGGRHVCRGFYRVA